MNHLLLKLILCTSIFSVVGWTYATECDKPVSSEDVAYCLGSELRDSDLKINQTYQSLISKLPLDEQKKLRNDQRIWIKERDEVCNCASREQDREKWYQGVLKDYRKTVCVTRYTRQRTAELDRMLVDISQKTKDQETPPAPVSLPSTTRKYGQSDYQLWAKNSFATSLWYFEVTVNTNAIAGFSPSALWIGCLDARSRNAYGTLTQIRGTDTNSPVFSMGYALDLSSGKLYIRRDGIWSKGSPGSSGGLDLKLGTIYSCGIETTVPIAPLIDKGYLQANFGEKPFVYAMPDGYKPLIATGAGQSITSPYKKIEEDRFVISGDEVYDRKTDRTWKRCNYGQTWDEQNRWCKGVIKRVPIAHASAEIEGIKGGWRVPDVNELMSFFDVYCRAKKSNAEEIFVDVKDEWYATSTPHGGGHVMAVECFGAKASSAGVGDMMMSIIRLVREGK